MVSLKGKSHFLNALLFSLKKEKNCVFLNTQRVDKNNYRSFLFLRPLTVIATNDGEEVLACLQRIGDFTNKGFYAAGYFSYEAGLFFEEKLAKNRKFDFPLLWFGIYKKPLVFNHKTLEFSGNVGCFKPAGKMALRCGQYKISSLKLSLSENQYVKCIEEIKRYIEKGHTYQVNFTFKCNFDFSGSSQKLFFDLSSRQAVSYAAFIKHDNTEILSFSPELFFKKDANRVVVKPMKGTAPRGLDAEGDELKQTLLLNSRKDRAENIMIVDLLRNDLGRISRIGTVKPIRIFEVEKYATLFQMVSSIKAVLEGEVGLTKTFTSLFPSGSVTGAPKIKTMQIIENLEKEPRKIYTGAIGFISPRKESVFNVAIRTILIDKKRKKGEMGIGSGIVYDSDARAEYSECKLKADFLVKNQRPFSLIETILWKGNFFLLALHLKRLKNSAEYFGFKFDRREIIKLLAEKVRHFGKEKTYKIRLLLEKSGKIAVEAAILRPAEDKTMKVVVSKKKINSQDLFVYHKTTNRKMYDEEYLKCRRKGFNEVIFINEKNQVAEGAVSNIVIKKNGFFYTPPVSCGLLNGVFRQHLFRGKKLLLKEKVLYKKDLYEAEGIYFINSVRGMREARLVNSCI